MIADEIRRLPHCAGNCGNDGRVRMLGEFFCFGCSNILIRKRQEQQLQQAQMIITEARAEMANGN